MRCESCDGPSHDGNLCPSCQSAFQDFLGGTSPKAPASDLPATLAQTAPVAEASPGTTSEHSGPLPDASQWFEVLDVAAAMPPLPVIAEAVIGSQGDLEAAKAEAARVEAAEAEATRLNAARAEAARIEAARREIAKEEAAKAQSATNEVAPIETGRPAPKAATPAAASKGAGGMVQSRQRTGSMMRVAAAAVIFAATGLGVSAYWFKIQGLPIPGQAQPTSADPSAVVAERVSRSPDPPTVVEKTAKPRETTSARDRATPARPPAAPKARAAASSSVRPRVPPKADRQPTAPIRQVASDSAPAVVTEAPEREAAPPPVAVASPPPASTAPLGPFFETKEVNESPRVTSRVEPKLPDDLRAHELNDVVVVRLLVSQSGHPSRLSLLRRSKAGRSLDDAVVGAVKQWTFSPARKKGEAVSCWFNIGVPVVQAN